MPEPPPETSRSSRPPALGATVELEGLTKQYPGRARPAVDGADLRIEAGETVVLVGPPGCGKSTALKMINRLVEPTRGRVLLGGRDVARTDPVRLRRGIGYAVRSGGLFPHLTVAQNVALVPRMLRWPEDRVRARVEEVLDLVGLDPGAFHDRRPHQLPEGGRQRAGLARALAADPPVLLLDDPFGAVDPAVRDRLGQELVRLRRRLHKTVVLATRDFDEAVGVGDRIAVVRDRFRVVQFDTPRAVLARPADDFVSGLAGADTALGRLGLTRIRDVGTTAYPAVAANAPVRYVVDRLRAGGADGILLLDGEGRPHRWLRPGDLMRDRGSPARAGTPVRATVSLDATLRDALEAVLADGTGRVVVTGRGGAYEGVVDLRTLMDSARALPGTGRAGRRGPGTDGAREPRAGRTRTGREGVAGEARA